MEAFGQPKEKMGGFPGSRRDPFSLPPGVRPLSEMSITPGAKKSPQKTENKLIEVLPSLEVNAILISDHVRLALINRHIVTIGDLIHDERVIHIEKNRVILKKGDQKRTLHLAQSPISLTVED